MIVNVIRLGRGRGQERLDEIRDEMSSGRTEGCVDILLVMRRDEKASMKIRDAKHQPITNCRPQPLPITTADTVVNAIITFT
jgi:hypothetical protein